MTVLSGNHLLSSLYISKFYEEKDGVLYHILSNKITKEKNSSWSSHRRRGEEELLQVFHDGLDGGHYGRDNTLHSSQTCEIYKLDSKKFP